MSVALYRRYRSATFADLVGQEPVARTLRHQVASGQVAHAYLFTGIRGTGKTSSARILARAVVCLDPRDGEPCNACSACLEVLEGRAVDVLEIDAASNRGIDEMRDLRERVKFLPAVLRRKVYIVDEAHMLTTEAWNAFLKTLEEPPDHVLFVLATTEPHKVPETVRSRVQRFDFRRVGPADLVAHLGRVCAAEGVEATPEALALVADAGQGSVRDALSVLDQAMSVGSRPIGAEVVRQALGLADPAALRDLLGGLAAGDAGRALRAAGAAFDGGADPRQLLRELGRWARAAELVAIGYPEGVGAADVDFCAQLAGTAPAGLWVDAVDRFAVAEVALRQPVDARLQVELALLQLSGRIGLEARVAELERLLEGAGETAVAGTAIARRTVAVPRVAEAREPTTRAGASAAVPPATASGPTQAAGDPATASGPTQAAGDPATTPAAVAGPRPGLGQGDREPAGAAVAASPAGAGPAVAAPPATSPSSPGAGTGGGAAHPGDPHAAPTAESAATSGPTDPAGWETAFPAIVEALGRRDPMLAGVLRSCRPVDGDAGRLVIAAPYGFHHERLRDPLKAPLLASVVAEVVGRTVVVEAVHVADKAPVAAATPPARPSGGERPTAPGSPASPAQSATEAVIAAFPGSRITGSRLLDSRGSG